MKVLETCGVDTKVYVTLSLVRKGYEKLSNTLRSYDKDVKIVLKGVKGGTQFDFSLGKVDMTSNKNWQVLQQPT